MRKLAAAGVLRGRAPLFAKIHGRRGTISRKFPLPMTDRYSVGRPAGQTPNPLTHETTRMNHLNWSRSAGIALTATLVTFCCPAARADWIGDTSNDWNDALNWPDDILPAQDRVHRPGSVAG